MLELLDDSRAAINPWGLLNQVPCIEEPHTMVGASHTAGFRCIHEQSLCRRPHQVMGSPWAWSVIWREWKHRHWEEPKTANRGQCSNKQCVGYETRFGQDKWESIYFKIVWKFWNWPSYSIECLLNWLHWHLDVETSSFAVKKPKYKSQCYLLWMWKHRGISHQSCLSEPTYYENSPVSGSRIPNTAIISHSSKLRMNGPLWSTWWTFEAIPILDPVDVEEAYCIIVSRYHSRQWQALSHGWHYARFS